MGSSLETDIPVVLATTDARSSHPMDSSSTAVRSGEEDGFSVCVMSVARSMEASESVAA